MQSNATDGFIQTFEDEILADEVFTNKNGTSSFTNILEKQPGNCQTLGYVWTHFQHNNMDCFYTKLRFIELNTQSYRICRT